MYCSNIQNNDNKIVQVKELQNSNNNYASWKNLWLRPNK